MNKLSEEQKDICVAMYNTGKSIASIRNHFKKQFKEISEALGSRGIKIRKRKTSLNIEYFKEINTPEKAYWLGFIAADGCVHKHGWKVSIGSKDSDILPKFQKAIGSSSPVSYRESLDKRTLKTYSAYFIQIYSKQFASFVRSQGINEDKSKNFQFPTHLPRDLWVHFIRGMFDGDGGLMIRGNVTNINIVSTLAGAIFLRDFVKNELKFAVKKLRSVPEQGIHYFEMTRDSVKFLEWIYSPSTEDTRLNRKYEKYLKAKTLKANNTINYIISNPLGEVFQTENLLAFCREREIRATALLVSFKSKRPVSRGKSFGWKILSKSTKISAFN